MIARTTKKGRIIAQAEINEDALAMCRYDDEKRHAGATQMAMRLFQAWDNISCSLC